MTRIVAIAVADDTDGKSIETALREDGFRVYRVGAGEELRYLLRNMTPHLVLVDTALEDVPAFELCRELREEAGTRRISVLVLLPPHGVTLEECFVSGVNDFVGRPIDLEEIRSKAERLTRIADRRRLNTLALVKLDGEEAALLGRTINLSPTGLLLELDAPLKIGSVCEVRFNLPGHQTPVRARGVIRRRAPEVGPDTGGFGIEFATLGPEDRGRLNRFLEESRESGR